MCEKKIYEKKNGTENWLGYCSTVSQYNEKLYCDTTGFGECKMVVECVTIQPLYCDLKPVRLAEVLGHNTRIVL